MENRMNKRYVDIDDVLNLFGVRDEDIYAQETIEDALYNGTLKVYKLPSTERHGKWIDLHCSVCGKIGWMDEDNYCPNCGAKMDLEGDAE